MSASASRSDPERCRLSASDKLVCAGRTKKLGSKLSIHVELKFQPRHLPPTTYSCRDHSTLINLLCPDHVLIVFKDQALELNHHDGLVAALVVREFLARQGSHIAMK